MDTTQGKTVGELLRAARERKKLSIEQVNKETRISVQTIRSLEQDDFGAFPSETYLKGFLRNYADFLGLDSGELWTMIGHRSSSGGAGPSWDTEEAMRVEKLGAPRVVGRLLIPILVVVVIVLIVLLIRERNKPEVSRHGGSPPVEEVGAAG